MREMASSQPDCKSKGISATQVTLIFALLGFFLLAFFFLDEIYMLIVDAWYWIPFYTSALW